MADIPVRFAGLRGTLAAFAVDLFAGRVGSLTDAPMCSGGYDRWGVYDGSAWRLGPASDYAGNANVLSLLVNGTSVIDSSRNIKANEVWAGGAIRVNLLGDATFRNITASALTANKLPKAITGGLLADSAVSEDATYVRSSKPMSIDSTLLRIAPAAGQATLGMDTAAGNAAVNVAYTAGSARWLWGKSNDAESGANAGSDWYLRAYSDAGVLIDTPIQIARVAGGQAVIARPLKTTGGIAAFNVTPPATRPTISGQRTATATLAALYQALSATGLILDSTTGSSVQREFPMQNLPITNSAPAVVTIVNANMKGYGFSGTLPAEEMFYDVDLQHDYIAGTDIVFHIHWAPAVGTGGNVKWQLHYQWTENGAVVQAPTLVSVVTAASTTALTSTMSAITISGVGHTYQSVLNFRLFRDSTDASDTYAGTAIMLSRGTHYQSDPGQA